MSVLGGSVLFMRGSKRTYATWSPTNRSSFVTLSNGNLSLVGTTGQFGSVISNIGIAPGGTGYYEATVDFATSGGAQFIGMGDFIPPGGFSVQQVAQVLNSFAFRGNTSTETRCIRKVFTGSTDAWVGLNPCTIALGSPCIVTVPNHNYYTGMQFVFTTTGALPIGLSTSTNYWVHVIDANTFYVAATLADSVSGPYKNGTLGQSGVHRINPTGLCAADLVGRRCCFLFDKSRNRVGSDVFERHSGFH